jgi:hypothetical protein
MRKATGHFKWIRVSRAALAHGDNADSLFSVSRTDHDGHNVELVLCEGFLDIHGPEGARVWVPVPVASVQVGERIEL